MEYSPKYSSKRMSLGLEPTSGMRQTQNCTRNAHLRNSQSSSSNEVCSFSTLIQTKNQNQSNKQNISAISSNKASRTSISRPFLENSHNNFIREQRYEDFQHPLTMKMLPKMYSESQSPSRIALTQSTKTAQDYIKQYKEYINVKPQKEAQIASSDLESWKFSQTSANCAQVDRNIDTYSLILKGNDLTKSQPFGQRAFNSENNVKNEDFLQKNTKKSRQQTQQLWLPKGGVDMNRSSKKPITHLRHRSNYGLNEFGAYQSIRTQNSSGTDIKDRSPPKNHQVYRSNEQPTPSKLSLGITNQTVLEPISEQPFSSQPNEALMTNSSVEIQFSDEGSEVMDDDTTNFQSPQQTARFYEPQEGNATKQTRQIEPKEVQQQEDSVEESSFLSNSENSFLLRVSTCSLSERPNIKHCKTVYIPEPSLEQFIVGPCKGKGQYGKVYMAVDRETGFIVALKQIPKRLIRTMTDQFIQELKLQTFLSSPFVVKVFGFFSTEEHFYIIMEYLEEGSLYEHVKKKGGSLSEHETSIKGWQIAKSIEAIHLYNIIHRDIKPENIVLTNGVCKLADFGWAASYNSHKRRQTNCGTLDYLSPEIVRGQEYSSQVDIWGFGVLLYEILVGKAPFYNFSTKETLKKIQSCQYSIPNHLSQSVRALLDGLLQKNASSRMSISELVQNDFFKQE